MIMLDNDDDPKQYDQTYQTIQPRLPTCASSTAARTGTDCLNHHRQKRKKNIILLFCLLPLGLEHIVIIITVKVIMVKNIKHFVIVDNVRVIVVGI